MGGLCQTEQNRECLRGLVFSNISLPDQWEAMTQPHRETILLETKTLTGVKDMTDIQHEVSQ